MRFSMTRGGANNMKFLTETEALGVLNELADKLNDTGEKILMISTVMPTETVTNYGTINDGIKVLKRAKTIIYSSTQSFGSFDLYHSAIPDVRKIEISGNEIIENILFPIMS